MSYEVRTDINKQPSQELKDIHFKRWNDAIKCVFFELMRLEDPRVNKILSRYQVTIMAGYSAGIEYPEGLPQILEAELIAIKERLAKDEEEAE